MSQDTMIRALPEWKEETTLTPFSGVQMLDFGFTIDEVKFRSARFVERTTRTMDANEERMLIPCSGDEEADDALLGALRQDDLEYSISKIRALEPFLEKWTPVPVLRIKPSVGADGRELYDDGPIAWARVLVKELRERGPDGMSHRVVLAMDTSCEAGQAPNAYLAPHMDDGEREFRFVSNPDDMAWFLRRRETDANGQSRDLQAWVNDCVKTQFHDFKQSQRPDRPFDPETLPYLFEHWARYLAFIRLLDDAVAFPKIRLLDTISVEPETREPRYRPVDVDLVLDIGNSRTCGILIETLPTSVRANLNNSYVLALRDLSDPLYRYRGAFESRVEFSNIRFGALRPPGRTRSFFWPSLVRAGPEAVRLTRDADGTETLSGISSPKRYLWDNAPMTQDWRFHFFKPSSAEPLPLIARAVQNELNENGDVLDQVRREEEKRLRERGVTSLTPAIRPRFSRSSIYGMLLTELIMHALVQINDPAQRETREESNLPRRLRRIILTLPSATPMQEQAIMRSRAEGALKLLYNTLRWTSDLAINTEMPEVIVEWDEASCTQMVYLYTEITQKFGGQIESFFNLMGRPRVCPPLNIQEERRKPTGRPEPSIRIGCIDIGGGTTDLMVTTFFSDSNKAITPRQDFREGFKVAGDDLVRHVISRIVLPQIAASLSDHGVGHADDLLRVLFGGDIGDADVKDRQRRRQFALRVLTPIGLKLLQASETLGLGEATAFLAGDALGWVEAPAPEPGAPETQEEGPPPRRSAAPQSVLDYLEAPVRERGGRDWSLADLEIVVERSKLDAVVQDKLQKALSDMCELVGALECDVLLLSGRPSQLPAVRDIVREAMVVPPSRLISMHDYKVGPWFPYRDPVTNRIGDPKTTAAVGGMLCTLAESRIANFTLFTREIVMNSTARYIGELEGDQVILKDKVLFSADDDRNKDGAVVDFYGPTYIGFRQLRHERWTTTDLYKLDFANAQAAKRPRPLRITLSRREVDNDPETVSEVLRAEAVKEAIVVSEIEDGAGGPAKPSDVALTLHTLGAESDYWLDTGVFTFS
ncbi:MAG: virulence factor SrfB [Pseudomonadota bacterium]